MSTRRHLPPVCAPGAPGAPREPHRRTRSDCFEAVALVAHARREHLLARHRRRLSRADLEDCYSQATLELLASARHGVRFHSCTHIANTLEQRLLARVHDRRRALSGRSPIEAALASALPLLGHESDGVQVEDPRLDPVRAVAQRELLRRTTIALGRLSADQRLALANQVSLTLGCAEFCRLHGWSAEKYRKTGQRARARLRRELADEFQSSCPAVAGASE